PEDLLGAISVMGIEIDNRHAFGAIASLRMTARNGCIVEKAKAHGSHRFCMMAGGTRLAPVRRVCIGDRVGADRLLSAAPIRSARCCGGGLDRHYRAVLGCRMSCQRQC